MGTFINFRCGVTCVVHGETETSILLGKRINISYAGQWAMPGGHVEMGESVKDAALRKLYEETNLLSHGRMTVYAPILTYTNRKPFVGIPVEFHQVRGEMKPCDQFEELRFFEIKALPDGMFKPHIAVVEELALQL